MYEVRYIKHGKKDTFNKKKINNKSELIEFIEKLIISRKVGQVVINKNENNTVLNLVSYEMNRNVSIFDRI